MNSEQSIFKVEPKPFHKTVNVPSSKSYANRILILASIQKEPITLKNIPKSSDVITMVKCLREIGLEIVEGNDSLSILNSFPACEAHTSESEITLYTGDGGTTNRFILPLLSLGSKKYVLRPEGHMLARPMVDLFDGLRELGVKLDVTTDYWAIQGPAITEGTIEIDCSKTTQFLTGLSLAFSKTNLVTIPKNLSVSLPYWEMTKALITKFKKTIEEYVVPLDFSSLSYPLALAAVGGECQVLNYSGRDIYQADSVFIELLEKMGAKISEADGKIICKAEKLQGINFSGDQCPDVIPTLLFVCSFAEGKSTITNLEVLTHKECDRFTEMDKMMRSFGVQFTADYDNYSFTVEGKSILQNNKKLSYFPPEDHRMVMVSYLFLRALGGGVIEGNSFHVKKSFKNFFEVMDRDL